MITHKISKCAAVSDNSFQSMYNHCYRDLERRANISLEHELEKLRKAEKKLGSSKTKVYRINKLDIIENSEELKRIFESVIDDKYDWYKIGGKFNECEFYG